MSTFRVTTDLREIETRPGETGAVTFTIHNTSKVALDAQLELRLGDGAGWARLEGPGLVSVGADASVEVRVAVEAPSGQGKSSTIRLDVYGTENPETDTGASESVRVLVAAPPPSTPAWVWGLVTAVVVLTLVVVVLAVKTCQGGPEVVAHPDASVAAVERPKLGEPCRAGVTCEEGLECHEAVCRLPTNARGCSADPDCVSGKCSSGICVVNLPGLGERCQGGLCGDGLICQGTRCVLADGKSGCTQPNHCETGYCDASGSCRRRPQRIERRSLDVRMGRSRQAVIPIASGWRYMKHKVSPSNPQHGRVTVRKERDGNRVARIVFILKSTTGVLSAQPTRAAISVTLEQDDPPR